MKIFPKLLLSIIFVVLIASSVQSIHAEQNIPIKGLFSSPGIVELVTTKDTNYQIYLQLVVRNNDGQIINVTENTAHGSFIPHMISDHVFDTLMGEKEIITIDSMEYEKSQWKFRPSLEQRFVGMYPIYSEVNFNFVSKHGDDTVKMYEYKKDYSLWKIHYCANFNDVLGFLCVPVFQALVPNMTMEPGDTVDQQWTILREIE